MMSFKGSQDLDASEKAMSATFLTTLLRESAPYLREAGSHQTAALLIAAADEIERLTIRLAERKLATNLLQRAFSCFGGRGLGDVLHWLTR